MQKIIIYIKRSSGIIPVGQLKEEQWRKKDKRVECLCITLNEQAHLIQLQRVEPMRSNDSYIAALFLTTRKIISLLFISFFYKKVGLFAGIFQKLPTYII